LNNNNNMLF